MEITKRNCKKLLRELDLAEYPSLDEYLIKVRNKLLNKESLSVAEELMTYPKFKNYFENYRREANRYYVSSLNFDKFSHRPPRPFQEEGIKFLLLNDRVILADDMGLGKSIQSILAALMLPEDYKILIVTMKSLKYNIEEEIKPYTDSYKVIEKTWETGYKFTIVHYEALKKWKKEILKEKFQCIIADESHLLKNSKVGRSKNFNEIIKDTEKVWLLTGTPMTNRPIDYYNLLKMIKHPVTKNWVTYIERYCDGKKIFGHWDIKGASNLDELYNKTKASVMRRLKKDVLDDLPNKERTPVFLHLESLKEYNKVIETYREAKLSELEGFSEYFNEEDFDIAEMTKFILWRQYCAMKKIEDGSLVELIDTQIEADKKIVVFTNFTKVVDTVYEKFGHDICRFIDGRISDAKERLNIVKNFNEDPSLKVLICNLKVGSVGLNIQSANVAIINDMDWVPSTMLQAEDRLWRIGQLQEVTILYPVYKGTVEEVVFNVVNSKMKNISVAIEGKKESYFISEEDITEDIVATRKSILSEIFSQLG
jgi:SWI/SNF-related matrix-associated actin-dependent regulator 1 of chromatin subfamily A